MHTVTDTTIVVTGDSLLPPTPCVPLLCGSLVRGWLLWCVAYQPGGLVGYSEEPGLGIDSSDVFWNHEALSTVISKRRGYCRLGQQYQRVLQVAVN